MIFYEDEVKKSVRKRLVPQAIFKRFKNIFIALETTGDLGLFDIKKLKTSGESVYYKLLKGKHRAIFFIENNDYFVIRMDKREDVYQKWGSSPSG